MNTRLQESIADLLSCFFNSCEDEFGFIPRDYGYTALQGLTHIKSGRQVIAPYKGEKIQGNFWAVSRFEKDDRAIVIGYGDRGFLIEGWAYFGGIDRLGLAEMLWAARKNEKALEGGSGIVTAALVKETIENMAAAFKRNEELLLSPTPKVLERTIQVRGKLLQQNIREQYKREMKAAAAAAARAFIDKDFRRVIAVLSIFEKDLAAGELKKLEIARKALLGE